MLGSWLGLLMLFKTACCARYLLQMQKPIKIKTKVEPTMAIKIYPPVKLLDSSMLLLAEAAEAKQSFTELVLSEFTDSVLFWQQYLLQLWTVLISIKVLHLPPFPTQYCLVHFTREFSLHGSKLNVQYY